MKKVLLICMSACCLIGCGGKSAPSVDKKAKAEYSPKEVEEILTKAGYKISSADSYVMLVKDGNYEMLGLCDDGKLWSVTYNYDKGKTYLLNLDDEAKDSSAVDVDDDKVCFFDVNKQKEISSSDEDSEPNCDEQSIEESNQVYKAFYALLKEQNLNREELLAFFTSKAE